MEGWLVKLEKSLDEGRLLRGVGRLLVGVSGGPDSIALLSLLADRRDAAGGAGAPELIAGHVHHGLRGRDADLDEEEARRTARDRKIELVVFRGDAARVAAERKESLEAAGRALRQEAFRGWARDLELDAIALGHHLDDQAETVLLRAARGSGVRGLAGIPRERLLGGMEGARVRILRPLLDWRRKDILEYLASRGQGYRLDASNEDRSIPRNLVRHEVLPLLERGAHPGAIEALARLGEHARRLANDLESLGARALEESRIEANASDTVLSVASLRVWPFSVVHEALRLALLTVAPGSGLVLESRASRIIRRWLEARGASEGRIELGPGSNGGPVQIELRYGRLTISRRDGTPASPGLDVESAELAIPGRSVWKGWEITVEAREASGGVSARAGAGAEELDAELLARQGSMRVRSRREGDRFWPLGAPGSKKLKELFREMRVHPRDRDAVPLIAAGEEIAWVVGYRIAHPFRVTPETRRVVVIRARKE